MQIMNISDESMAMLIEMADDGGEEEGRRPTTETLVGDNTTLSFVQHCSSRSTTYMYTRSTTKT
jgi:hypothetical protein